MPPNITRYLNRTILVSIPALFDDVVCRPYTLLGAELTGLWLQSEELIDRLLPDESGHFRNLAPVVFVPFSHIAGVLIATGAPATATTTQTETTGTNVGTARRPEQKPEKSERGRTKRSAK